MKPSIGFRTRVLGSFVALVAGASFAGLFFQRAVLIERLEGEVDDSLEQERTELESLAAGTNPATGQPFGDDVRAIFDTFLRRNVPAEGEVYYSFVDGGPYVSPTSSISVVLDEALLNRWATLSAGEWGRLSTDAGPMRYLAVPLRFDGSIRGVFVIANFVQGEVDEIESTVRVAALVAGGILVVATGVAWLVAGRLLRPIRQLTEAAESISDTDLERRIPVEGTDEIARLAHQFNEMVDRLASSFASQRAFVDDAGHELRTPITVVRGHLELMGDDPDDRRETIALVTDELDRMSRIVDDLLVLAKSEQPDFVRRDTLEIADFTADVLAKAHALDGRAWRLDATGAGEFRADRDRLNQAMLNLVRNAIEHTPSGTEIAIGSALGRDSARIWVRDQGPGIDADEQARIFERFARGRSGRRRSEGAGLGLAIVRSIAEAHGGTVELVSSPGNGATFTIVIPLDEEVVP